MTARPPDLEGDASDDFADHAWAMLMARLNNDRSPKLHKEVHCTLIVRESTIKCAAKVRGGNALDARASLPAKPFGGLRSNGTERLLPGKQTQLRGKAASSLNNGHWGATEQKSHTRKFSSDFLIDFGRIPQGA